MRNGHFGTGGFGHKEESFLDDELILAGEYHESLLSKVSHQESNLCSEQSRPWSVI